MLNLEKTDLGIYVSYIDNYERSVKVDISGFLILNNEAEIIIRPLLSFIDRVTVNSQKNFLFHLKEFGNSLHRNRITQLPENEIQWQNFVMIIHKDILLNTHSKATLKTRILCNLQVIFSFFSHLQDEGLIPLGVEFPDTTKRFETIDYSSHLDAYIGGGKSIKVEEFSSKLLVDISLSRTDAEYLDQIYRELSHRRKILYEVLLTYWKSFKEHVILGKNLIASQNPEVLYESLRVNGTREIPTKQFTKGQHLLTLSTIEGLSRYLSLANSFGGLPTDAEIRRDKLFPHPTALPDLNCKYPFPENPSIKKNMSFIHLRLMWMLGRITARDIAVFSALLIMEHPSFTPMAMTHAKLVNKSGKKYIEFGEVGETFIVHKHRAKSTKRETLSDLGYEIISFITELYDERRHILQKEKNPLSNFLFIPYELNGRFIVSPNHQLGVSYLSGTSKNNQSFWIGNLYPKLQLEGYSKNTINLKKIRNTEGVLEWFRSGSVTSTAKKLGNKTKTTITYYLPPTLLAAWNTRLIRRFQNLWITIAAANQPFLLEVTDFQNLGQLNSFIDQMLIQHPADSSPLAEKLHECFQLDSKVEIRRNTVSASLSVSISVNSLAALYLYQETAFDTKVESKILEQVDNLSGFSPRYFMDLARLLKIKLSNHINPEYLAIHLSALELSSSLRAKVNWKELFIQYCGDNHG